MDLNARRPDESFEDYKLRRKAEKAEFEFKLNHKEYEAKRNYLFPNNKLDEFRYTNACKQISKEHDTVLREICEFGEQDIKEMRIIYILMDNDKREQYINHLQQIVMALKASTFQCNLN